VRLSGRGRVRRSARRGFERVEAARGATPLTYFEFGTLAALAVFAEGEVEAAILEVGLGGRLDAVNIVDADVAPW
jgi:dihydrofolate synthase/folylpolyglutamate synthase